MSVDVEAQARSKEENSNGTMDQPREQAGNGITKKPRPRRPNYNEVHAKSLPLNVYPLPTFIPHNPISIVQIAIAMLSRYFFSPRSHSVIHNAYFSSETQSVHVTNPGSVRALWEQGFWGKGSLSRSEPQWLAGERKKRGITESKTSAEVTQSRREERKQFKLERARAQREAIEQQLRQEGKLDADKSIEEMVNDGQIAESPKGTVYTPNAEDMVPVSGESMVSEIDKSFAHANSSWSGKDEASEQVPDIKDEEHLQLTLEEAFFLTYALGVLSIFPSTDVHNVNPPQEPYSSGKLLRLFAAHASSPVAETEMLQLRSTYQSREQDSNVCSWPGDVPFVEPDNHFILRYIVYHHFRSLGWVVRPGIKFAVDYLLYLRGPAFHHAEFAIMIIPSYSDPYWSEAPEHESKMTQRRQELSQKNWWWLHRVNRVQTAVFKTLVLVYVEIPKPWDEVHMQNGCKVDIGRVLKAYTVREVVVRRWSPNRNRD